LIEREKNVEEKNAFRIEEIKVKKTEQKNHLIAKIQRRKIKILRKMLKSRKEIDQDTHKRDIIEEYANFSSRVYAGIAREGLSLDKIANKYEVSPAALNTYQGLEQLTQGIKPSVFETKVNVEAYLKNIEKSYTRLENFHRQELKKAAEVIWSTKKKELKQEEEAKDGNNYSTINLKNKIRPGTPTWVFENGSLSTTGISLVDYRVEVKKRQAGDNRQAAILLFQRLLRGRAI